jgi:hypothetical protein
MKAKTGLVGFVVGVCLLLALPAVAQQSTEIHGKVVDPDGLAIPGATVTATNEGTGLSLTDVTGAGGAYVISQLPPGRYTVVIEMDGFSKVTRTGLVQAAGSQTTVDVRLQLSGVQETLVVTGDAPIVDRTSNKLGATLSTREMEEVPANFRNFRSCLASRPPRRRPPSRAGPSPPTAVRRIPTCT